MPQRPADVAAPTADAIWPRAMHRAASGDLIPAGVLIPVVQREHALTVLLTQRSAALKHHAGQVSFPGGRMEPDDRDVLATALRETHEEVGIMPDSVDVAGFLPPMPTITGYAVTPVIGILGAGTAVTADPAEVEYAFEVPLNYFLDRANDVAVERELFGETHPMIEFHWQGERIWGATAYMIIALRKILIK